MIPEDTFSVTILEPHRGRITHLATTHSGIRCDRIRRHRAPLSGDTPEGTWDHGTVDCRACHRWEPPQLQTGPSTAWEDQ